MAMGYRLRHPVPLKFGYRRFSPLYPLDNQYKTSSEPQWLMMKNHPFFCEWKIASFLLWKNHHFKCLVKNIDQSPDSPTPRAWYRVFAVMSWSNAGGSFTCLDHGASVNGWSRATPIFRIASYGYYMYVCMYACMYVCMYIYIAQYTMYVSIYVYMAFFLVIYSRCMVLHSQIHDNVG